MSERETNSHQRRLQKNVKREVRRLSKAEKERKTLLALTAYVGALGLLLVLPVVIGAYLGRWLDSLFAGYSILWTLSLILVGVVVGVVNVYLMIKE